MEEMSILEQEVRDPFIDQNQNEFELKSCSPFHELKKDDYLLEFIFCLRCGDEKRPKILEKFILKREKDIEDQLVDEYYKDGEETKHRRVKKAKFKGILICYCEILNCDCGELIYRTFNIYEDQNEPIETPKVIPVRKDKIALLDESDDEEFQEIYERYNESISAYNIELNYSSGVSTRSVLELLCKKRGHFDEILKSKIGGRELDKAQIVSLKRSIGLEEQIKKLITEIKIQASNHFDENDFDDLKNMMYWMHKIVHGNITPTADQLKTAFKIIEEIFEILYFEPAKLRKNEENKKKRAENLKKNNKRFSSYSRR